MKIAARKNSSLDEQRRYRRQYDRDRSPALRSAFPQLLQLNIELSFGDRTGAAPKEVVPSSQSHAFYPPAQAFFRFRCPCADCDGEFDLSTNVAQLAATTGRGSPPSPLRCIAPARARAIAPAVAVARSNSTIA